jgi:predicted enzyme related to lactoylglutathione lyase
MPAGFCAYQLRTTDPEAARAFYAEVLGRAPPIDRLPERAAAAGAPPHWLGWVGADDVEATVARLVARGGVALAGGVLRDPFGSVVGVGARRDPGGEVVWHQLHTQDPSRALAFYGEALGWREVERTVLGGDEHTTFAWGGEPCGVVSSSARRAGVHPHWSFFFPVPDVETALARGTALGGSPIAGPVEAFGMRLAVAHDPQGAEYALAQLGP